MKRSFEKFVSRLESIGLRSEIETRAMKLNVTFRELYDGPSTPSIVTARRAVYGWLNRKKGKREIARLFDRAPNGIVKLLRERGS
jgi:hypothetical protein